MDHSFRVTQPRGLGGTGLWRLPPAFACDLEHVELLKFVIITYHTHAAGALIPNELREIGRAVRSGVDLLSNAHLEYLDEDEYLRGLQIHLEPFRDRVGHSFNYTLSSQSTVVPSPQFNLILFPEQKIQSFSDTSTSIHSLLSVAYSR